MELLAVFVDSVTSNIPFAKRFYHQFQHIENCAQVYLNQQKKNIVTANYNVSTLLAKNNSLINIISCILAKQLIRNKPTFLLSFAREDMHFPLNFEWVCG